MKEIYELNIYRLAEELSDMIWYAFDPPSIVLRRTGEWSEKAKRTIGYQIIKSFDSIAANLACPV
ncbi:MAG: hypothetical protein KAW92_14725 [Candidatus Cloacimonetes bacterium]|nr:hypothetical protein [Candidatus Cloacimonadota bacterium]